MQRRCKFKKNSFFKAKFVLMNSKKINHLLDEHKLRKTEIRRNVLSVFLQHTNALANQDIEDYLHGEVDRITLYRTLNKFVAHGLIHRIENATTTHYALCDNCEIHEHDDDHVHFQCVECDKMECIDQSESLKITIPENYQLTKMNILLKGICADCRPQSSH